MERQSAGANLIKSMASVALETPKPPKIYASGLVCREILEEVNSVLSAIRIVNTLNVNVPEGSHAGDLNLPPIEARALIHFSAEGPTEFDAVLRVTDPLGKTGVLTTLHGRILHEIHFHTINIGIKVDPAVEGLFTLEVLVNEEIKLRLPLRVTHIQVPALPSSPPSGMPPSVPSE